MKWTGKTWAEFYKITMIDRASGYVDPDEDFQLEEEEDQDVEEEEYSLKKMNQRLFKLVNHWQNNQQRPQFEWLVLSQCLQEQEAKIQQVNQLQQEQDKH